MGFPDGLFEAFSERYANELARINTKYLTALAERIGEIGRLKRVDFHRLERLRAYGSDYEAIKRELAALTGRTERAIQALIEAAAVESYGEMERLGRMIQRPLIPYAENAALQATVNAITRQTAGTFLNLSNTTVVGYAVRDGAGNIVFRGAGEAYRDAVDRAIHEVTMGLTDPAAAIRQTLKDLADSGLRQVDYASGRHRRLDSAVRMNVLDGMRQVYQGIQDELGDRLGADGVELSAHGSCAPDHLPYQGHQFSLKAFDELQSSLERPFGMWNCRHAWHRIILGVSRPAYTSEDLAELRRLSTERILFEGKEMTRYEAAQLQRRIETGVRAAKDRANIAASVGRQYPEGTSSGRHLPQRLGGREASVGDDVWRRAEQLRINQLMAKYQELSDAAGLPTRRERMAVSGFRPVRVEKRSERPKPINFRSGEAQDVGVLADLRDFYEPNSPGVAFAVPKPVIYNEFAKNHLEADDVHTKRFSWIEANEADFRRAISAPDVIEKVLRERRDGYFSATHIVRAANPLGKEDEYMAVAISLSREAGSDGFHQVTTIHPKKKRDIFRSDGTIKNKYVEIK